MKNVMSKILVAIVLYKPDRLLLKRNILALTNDVDEILLWENMSYEESMLYRIEDIPQNVKYIGEGKNIGISKALNRCLEYATKYVFSYFMSMDQDSEWQNFVLFKQSSLSFFKNERCIVGPYIEGENYKSQEGIFSVKWLITSGMFIPIDIINSLGGYNENFFVDGVDIEFSLRAHANSINTYINDKGLLKQQFGCSHFKRIFGKKIKVQYYDSMRLYDIFKGNIILYRIYKNKEILKELLVFLVVSFRSILFYNKDRKRRIVAIFQGAKEGFCYDKNKYYKFRYE